MRSVGAALSCAVAILARAAWGAVGGGSIAREEAELLARAGEAKFRLVLLRRQRDTGAGGPELAEATRSLEEARTLDPTNLRALGFLGLARLEAGRLNTGQERFGGRVAASPPVFDPDAFESARRPLEELFELCSLWADPVTREMLRDVVGCLDAALAAPGASPPEAAVWWRTWREVVLAVAESRAPHADEAALAEALLKSPFVWQRQEALEEIDEVGLAGPAVVAALAEALREDPSPWVRAAVAVMFGRLRPKGWDLRLADALRNDDSAYVRQHAARSLRPGRGVRTTSSTRPGGGDVGPGPAATKALVDAIGSDTPRVAAAALRALGYFEGSTEEILAALESPSALVREAAAHSIVRMAASGRAVRTFGGPDLPGRAAHELDDEVRRRLETLLEDRDVRVRLGAAVALSSAQSRKAREALEALVDCAVPVERFEEYGGLPSVGQVAGMYLEKLRRKERAGP